MLKYYIFFLIFGCFISKCSSEDSIEKWENLGRDGQTNTHLRKGYEYIGEMKSYYKYHKTPKNWHDAKRECSEEGAILFHPKNDDEANAVISFWKKHDPDRTSWILVGISDIVTEGVFVTIDGIPISKVYSKWRTNQPDNYKNNEDCAQMHKSGVLNDIPCDLKFSFICKKKNKKQDAKSTKKPDAKPTKKPDAKPTKKPDAKPTKKPDAKPTKKPDAKPTKKPDAKPTKKPDAKPTKKPDAKPTKKPDAKPTKKPDAKPTKKPDAKPTKKPDAKPTKKPDAKPTKKPDAKPTKKPDPKPDKKPTKKPDAKPTKKPDAKTTKKPDAKPDAIPTKKPDAKPDKKPDVKPTKKPDAKPDKKPDAKPDKKPDSKPDKKPDIKPEVKPDKKPDAKPDKKPDEKPVEKPVEKPDEISDEKSDAKSDTESDFKTKRDNRNLAMKTFIFWPNASVPFYIDPDHFDHDQRLEILKALAQIAFKSCIKFAPVLAAPTDDQHVMTFINPEGIKRCKIEIDGHSSDKPHEIVLGYECLHPPKIFMMIIRGLGLPFEHNRMRRDEHIEVKAQNIEPHYMPLFTKDSLLPSNLEHISYDYNSVMHFGERDYSKNGHKTIIFKGIKSQNRYGLTKKDIMKLDLIYGPECRKRDRAEKIAICQSFPRVGRRKREVSIPPVNRSWRVNPNITPPPHILAGITEKTKETNDTKHAEDSLKILGIEKETEKIIKLAYQLSALALKNANEKYCNTTTNDKAKTINSTENSDVLGVLHIIADFAKTIVDNAAENSKEFCRNSETIDDYQRQCKSHLDHRCPKAFRSECLTSDFVIKLVDKYKESENVKNISSKGVTVTTSTAKRRRKREATNTKTEDDSIKNDKAIKTEAKKDKYQKDKMKLIKEERLKEIEKAETTTKSALVSSTTASKVEDNKKEYRRTFTDKRYKVKDQQNATDWDESDTSLDRKNLEPEKTLNTKELLKKMLKVGAGAILKEVKEAEEKEKVDKGNVKREKKMAASSEESSNTEAESTEAKAEIVPLEEIDVDFDYDTQPKNSQQSQRTHKPGKVPKTVELSQLNKEFYHERKWPDGVVFYVIDKLKDFDLDDVRKRLKEVNNILMEKTCVQLRELNAKEAPGFDDYIVLDSSPDYVTGRVGRKQNFGCIELFEGGQHTQHAAMVVMAMLGFYFEVSRHDRDKYIRVHNRHIRPDKLHHFEKIQDEATLNIPYDYKSATHPSWQFWRKVGKKGISTVATFKEQDPDGLIMRSLGQNPELLSEFDILKINSVYGVDCFQSNRASNKTEDDVIVEEEVIQ